MVNETRGRGEHHFGELVRDDSSTRQTVEVDRHGLCAHDNNRANGYCRGHQKADQVVGITSPHLIHFEWAAPD